MSHTTLPRITESQILTSYLIPPAPLPTILPYSSFLALVPAAYRKDAEHTNAIKRLYRDLQFQRSITVDQVRENIERECGAHAASLRTRLAKQIAMEEGDVDMKSESEDEESGRSRKRRRRLTSEDEGEVSFAIKDEDDSDSIQSSHDEFTDPLHLAVQQAVYEHPSNLHPAAHTLSLSEEMMLDRSRVAGSSAFHTQESLLAAMRTACSSLDEEISELDAECLKLKTDIEETVSNLSDLRYGKRQSGGEDTVNEYQDVLDALQQFRNVINAKIEVQ